MPTIPFVAIHSAEPAPLPEELAYAPPRNTTTAGARSDRGVAGSTTLIDGRGRSGQSGTSNACVGASAFRARSQLEHMVTVPVAELAERTAAPDMMSTTARDHWPALRERSRASGDHRTGRPRSSRLLSRGRAVSERPAMRAPPPTA